MSAPDTTTYRADIDGLRALAVLVVVAFHAFPEKLPGGFIGVDLFFVISGYLIFGIILSQLQMQRFSLLTFYARRAKRIFPALFVVLASCLTVGFLYLTPAELIQLGKHTAAGAFFGQNIALWLEAGYFDTTSELKPLMHLWSLGVEEQFYLIFPLILMAVAKWGRAILSGAGLIWLILLLAAISFMANILLIGDHPTATFFLPFTRFWELLAGGALAAWTLSPRYKQLSGAPSHLCSITGLALVMIGLAVITPQHAFPSYWAMLPVLGAVCLIAAGPQGVINRYILSLKGMVAVGLISYPLYLWHWPLLSFPRIILAEEPSFKIKALLVLAAFTLATLTYLLIEKPVRFGLRNFKQRRLVPVYLTVLIALIGGAGILTVTPFDGFTERPIAQKLLTIEASYARDKAIVVDFERTVRKCNHEDGMGHLNERILEICRVFTPSPTATKTIVLWGDSHAGHWSPVFYAYARQENYRLISFLHPGCPPLLHTRRTDGIGNARRCDKFGLAEDVLEHIAKLDPVSVSIAARWSAYWHGSRNFAGRLDKASLFLTDEDHVTTATEETSQLAITRRLPETFGRLSDIAPIFVLKNLPQLRAMPGPGMLRLSRKIESTHADHTQLNQSMNRLLDATAAQWTNIASLDPATRICASGSCVAIMDNSLLYMDDNHVSASGSLLFLDDISAALNSLKERR